MKKVKLTFWILIIGLLALLVYQNQTYFFSQYSLGINLGFFKRVSPDIYNLVIIAAFFCFGLLIAYISSLFDKFKAKKTIKELKSASKSHQDTITQMRQEVDALKKPVEPETQPQVTDDAVMEPSDHETVQPPQS
jgi:NADH:ubiquinone oxidoreductase subunit 5 (subunit L)/multisubunit Na+/H+ antiporter MnhA subunit